MVFSLYQDSELYRRDLLVDFRWRLICFGILIGLSLFCLNRWGSSHQNPILHGFSYLTTPLQSMYTGLLHKGEDGLLSWRELMVDKDSAERLRLENERLKIKSALLESYQSENFRLRRLLRLSDGNPWRTVSADVIGRGREEFFTLSLNRGSAQGVLVGQPVIAEAGLVGRVISVQPNASLILQITDGNSSLGAFVHTVPDEASAEAVAGVLQGRSGWGLIFESEGGVKVATGAPVYSSSLSTIYPSGIKVGMVEREFESGYSLRRRFQVKPAVDFDRLREVLVLTGLHREEVQRLGSQDNRVMAGAVIFEISSSALSQSAVGISDRGFETRGIERQGIETESGPRGFREIPEESRAGGNPGESP